jgi:CRP/FNR family cyclic AMP-dependent transcriptional regulator
MKDPLVRIFEHEPEFLCNVPHREVEKASRAGVARVIELGRGKWRPPLVRLRADDVALLVLDGLIIRRVEVVGRTGIELIGAGDVLRPWSGDEEKNASVPASLLVEVSQPTHLAVLDREFVTAIARWPEILPQILDRMSMRTTSLAFQLAIAQLPHVESRVLCVLWHLADRWGYVGGRGVILRLGLSQRNLAELCSSARPTVNAALGRLKARGLVERSGWREYRLHGEPPRELDDLPTPPRWVPML